MRKRGKSRLSSPSKRATRYRLKYTVEEASKRAKKLLPVMYPLLEVALANWDLLEQMLFPEFEALGIDPSEYDYYLAWAKRKGEKGLRFADETMIKEASLLMEEFVARGLDRAKLEALEPTVDLWIKKMRGVACLFEFVDGLETADFSKWNVIITEPFEIVIEPVHHGFFSARSLEFTGELQHPIEGTPSPYYIRLWFRLIGTFPSSYTWSYFVRVWDMETVIGIGTRETDSPFLFIYGVNSGVWQEGSTAISLDEWHCLVIKIEGEKYTANQKVYLDGVEELSILEDVHAYSITKLGLVAVLFSDPYTGKLVWDCLISDPSTQPSCDYYEECEA